MIAARGIPWLCIFNETIPPKFSFLYFLFNVLLNIHYLVRINLPLFSTVVPAYLSWSSTPYSFHYFLPRSYHPKVHLCISKSLLYSIYSPNFHYIQYYQFKNKYCALIFVDAKILLLYKIDLGIPITFRALLMLLLLLNMEFKSTLIGDVKHLKSLKKSSKLEGTFTMAT